MYFRQVSVVFAVGIFSLAPAIAGEGEPSAVSPGAGQRFSQVETLCPTFSWQDLGASAGYELIVYELPTETELAAWNLDEAVEVLFVDLPAGVTAWSPAMEDGLARGKQYVWFVRGLFDDGDAEERRAGGWSAARFFQVAGLVQHAQVIQQEGSVSDTRGVAPRAERLEDGLGVQAESTGMVPTKDVGTATAAISGTMSNTSGEVYGVVGTASSPAGAGLGAVNTAGGPDLVLDGAEDGETDTLISQDGLVRSSPGSETFVVENTGGGQMHFQVTGTIHGNGSGLIDVDAETLDGINSSAFSPAVHSHDDRYFTETELTDAFGGGSVHWENLSSVPTGLDNGDDDTTYTAGGGLELSGTEFRVKGSGYQNVVVVAASGGDFTSIQAAIDSISDATESNPYLVWVAPGVFFENVTLTPHIHLQGAGEGVTVISSSIGGSASWGTLVLADDTSVRDLTVENTGSSTYNIALLAPSGTREAVVLRTEVRAVGSGGSINRAISLDGSSASTSVTLWDVRAYARYASSTNIGMRAEAATATLKGGEYKGLGGTIAFGIQLRDFSRLYASDVSGAADLGTNVNDGLRIETDSKATLDGGSFRAVRGNEANGIKVLLGGILSAANVAADAAEATESSGLHAYSLADVVVRGGSFSASNGDEASGIRTAGSGVILQVDDATATAENATSSNYGINVENSTVTLRGGSYSAVGGALASGAAISESNANLVATNLTLHGELGTANFSLVQTDGLVSAGVSFLNGAVSRSGGTLSCFQVFDASFSAVACP